MSLWFLAVGKRVFFPLLARDGVHSPGKDKSSTNQCSVTDRLANVDRFKQDAALGRLRLCATAVRAAFSLTQAFRETERLALPRVFQNAFRTPTRSSRPGCPQQGATPPCGAGPAEREERPQDSGAPP